MLIRCSNYSKRRECLVSRESKLDVVIANKFEFYDALPSITGMRQNNRIVGSVGVGLVAGHL